MMKLVIFLRMRKLKNRKMKTSAKMKRRSTFKKHMILCWKIVASMLVQHKEAKCEVERLKGELVEAYSKIKFLELEIIQANVKVENISTKKLDNVLSSQKS